MIPSLTTNQASARSAALRSARVPPSARPRPPTLPTDHRSVTVGPIKRCVGGSIKQVVEIRNFQRLTSSPADTVITAPLTGELSSFCLKVYPAGKGASTTSYVSAFLCLNTQETSHEIVLKDLWLGVENSYVHKKLGDRKFGTTQARLPNSSSARLERGPISGLNATNDGAAKPSHGVLLFIPHSQFASFGFLTRSGSLCIEVVANANIVHLAATSQQSRPEGAAPIPGPAVRIRPVAPHTLGGAHPPTLANYRNVQPRASGDTSQRQEVSHLLPISSLHSPETRRGSRLRRSVSSPCLSKMRVECPVCLDRVKPPMRLLQCDQGHVVCTLCFTQMVQKICPTCRGTITGKPTVLENVLGLA